ncbi:hypothetical protein PIB30_102608, partial [Stylosanthes scabra]|nr:hypothetical protein [Stylosanthes scabra]
RLLSLTGLLTPQYSISAPLSHRSSEKPSNSTTPAPVAVRHNLASRRSSRTCSHISSQPCLRDLQIRGASTSRPADTPSLAFASRRPSQPRRNNRRGL